MAFIELEGRDAEKFRIKKARFGGRIVTDALHKSGRLTVWQRPIQSAVSLYVD